MTMPITNWTRNIGGKCRRYWSSVDCSRVPSNRYTGGTARLSRRIASRALTTTSAIKSAPFHRILPTSGYSSGKSDQKKSSVDIDHDGQFQPWIVLGSHDCASTSVGAPYRTRRRANKPSGLVRKTTRHVPSHATKYRG